MTKTATASKKQGWLKNAAFGAIVVVAIVLTWIAARASAPDQAAYAKSVFSKVEALELSTGKAPYPVTASAAQSRQEATEDGSAGVAQQLEQLRRIVPKISDSQQTVVNDKADSAEVTNHSDVGATQLTYIRLNDGMHMGTSNERMSRAALSLSKLFIAYYVLEYGSTEEAFAALEMLTDSNDATAERLFAKYPESIDAVAKEFDLISTSSNGYWGQSVTSSYDVATFIAQLIEKSPEHPILVSMSFATEKAQDGYNQNFGTARLSNVLGTKWGWSNDRDVHSSVSFGANFVVAASVNGTAEELTKFVRNQVTADNLRAATTRFLDERDARRQAHRQTTTGE
ncbi:MAG: hypothetical protein SOW59_01715 [Corynebacterium sp.]|nr:hypothetical protein [Corynebacterium sp.]